MLHSGSFFSPGSSVYDLGVIFVDALKNKSAESFVLSESPSSKVCQEMLHSAFQLLVRDSGGVARSAIGYTV